MLHSPSRPRAGAREPWEPRWEPRWAPQWSRPFRRASRRDGWVPSGAPASRRPGPGCKKFTARQRSSFTCFQVCKNCCGPRENVGMRCSHVLAACGILRRSCMHTADNVSGRACPASNLAKVSKSSGSQTSIVARLTQTFCKSWSEGARSVAPAVRQAQATPKPPTLPAFRLQSTRVVPSTCSRHDAAACCSKASDAGNARSPSPQRADMSDMCPSGNTWRELMKPGKMLVSSKAMQATCAEARCFSVFDWREGELTSTQMTSSHNISHIPNPECKQQPP